MHKQISAEIERKCKRTWKCNKVFSPLLKQAQLLMKIMIMTLKSPKTAIVQCLSTKIFNRTIVPVIAKVYATKTSTILKIGIWYE
tara:strand:- start:242 stop:496 length:255 start_codon:yes stop_codon:yes gene_type:complete